MEMEIDKLLKKYRIDNKHEIFFNKLYESLEDKNTFVLNLEILSKINLDNIELRFNSECNTYLECSTRITDIEEDSSGVDIIKKMENVLLNEIVININGYIKNTKDIKTLDVSNLVHEIKIESTKRFTPIMYIKAKYDFK